MAVTFMRDKEGTERIKHIDDNKENDRLNNLMWHIPAPKGVTKKFQISILQYSLDEKLMREWDSSTQIQKELGIRSTSVVNCCKGRIKTSNGFIWKYKEIKDLENEIWKRLDLEGGYLWISNMGRIKNKDGKLVGFKNMDI